MIEYLDQFGVNISDKGNLMVPLFTRFAFNLLFTAIVVKGIYYQINKRREYLFTFFLSNIAIFFLSSILASVSIKSGFGFGLFAVFSMLRYRADTIEIKEMTFLFVCIVLAVINSLVTINISFILLFGVNICIILATYFLERSWLDKCKETFNLTYEKVELLHTDKREELLSDIKTRTGLDVTEVTVRDVNYINDSAKLTVFYRK